MPRQFVIAITSTLFTGSSTQYPYQSVSPPFAARNRHYGSVENPEGAAPDKTRKAGVGVVAKKGPGSEVSPGRGCPALRLLVEI